MTTTKPPQAYDSVQVPRRFDILNRLRHLSELMAERAAVPGVSVTIYQALVVAVEQAIEAYKHPTPERTHGKRPQ